jgi:hypothetical protein
MNLAEPPLANGHRNGKQSADDGPENSLIPRARSYANTRMRVVLMGNKKDQEQE